MIATTDRLDDAFHAAGQACADSRCCAPDVVDVLIDDTERDLVMWWLHDGEPEVRREWR